MHQEEWHTFENVISIRAYGKLYALLESFAETGEGDLPGRAFRWCSPGPSDPPGCMVGAFEAFGVVIYGHRARIGQSHAFFVKRITIDEPTGPAKRRTAPKSDDRQQQLPFERGKRS